jgi:sugar lactone lactonase YvrE
MNARRRTPAPGTTGRPRGALLALLVMALALWPAPALAGGSTPALDRPPTPGTVPTATEASIPRIHCPPGYTATVYADGLSAPDGLAFGPSGALHVAEETAGRVSRIELDGSATPVVTGLTAPEGIAFDDAGNLYVVEDVEEGRLVRVAGDGTPTTLTSGLDAPEGVVWWAGDDTLYVTESNAQFATIPPDPLRTHVTAVSPHTGSATRVLTDTLVSYAGITVGPDGVLYVTNEASGLLTDASVFTVDPDTGTRSLFASDLVAPEGLRFDRGDFPLYVAEEGTGAGGRLSRIEADGSHAPFCTGFQTIEDVALDGEGGLYVSEDGSGSIILIERRWRIWLPLVTRQHRDA